jgi:hypothetical protein
MRLHLNLNPHPERQILHPHGRQQRLMIRAVLAQVADQVLRTLHIHGDDVAADLVDLLPALAAGLLEGVLHVGEGLVDLLA